MNLIGEHTFTSIQAGMKGFNLILALLKRIWRPTFRDVDTSEAQLGGLVNPIAELLEVHALTRELLGLLAERLAVLISE